MTGDAFLAYVEQTLAPSRQETLSCWTISAPTGAAGGEAIEAAKACCFACRFELCDECSIGLKSGEQGCERLPSVPSRPFFVTPDMLHPEWKMLLSIDGLQEAGPHLHLANTAADDRQPDQAPMMRTTICRWRQMSAWRSTNVAVVVTLRSQIEILEKRLQCASSPIRLPDWSLPVTGVWRGLLHLAPVGPAMA
jgi:hypothetical protein